MNKEIYFCVDYESWHKWHKCYRMCSYEDTEESIKDGISKIVTMSLAHLSFDLIEQGYDIYLCYQDKKVKIEPHMDLSGIGEPCKELRFGHNIFKMFRAGIFNELLGIKKGELHGKRGND